MDHWGKEPPTNEGKCEAGCWGNKQADGFEHFVWSEVSSSAAAAAAGVMH